MDILSFLKAKPPFIFKPNKQLPPNELIIDGITYKKITLQIVEPQDPELPKKFYNLNIAYDELEKQLNELKAESTKQKEKNTHLENVNKYLLGEIKYQKQLRTNERKETEQFKQLTNQKSEEINQLKKQISIMESDFKQLNKLKNQIQHDLDKASAALPKLRAQIAANQERIIMSHEYKQLEKKLKDANRAIHSKNELIKTLTNKALELQIKLDGIEKSDNK